MQVFLPVRIWHGTIQVFRSRVNAFFLNLWLAAANIKKWHRHYKNTVLVFLVLISKARHTQAFTLPIATMNSK